MQITRRRANVHAWLLCGVMLALAACASSGSRKGFASGPPSGLEIILQAPVEAMTCDHLPFRLVVTNTSPIPVAEVHARVDLAAGLLTEAGEAFFEADFGVVPPGEAREARMAIKAKALGTYTNCARVTSAGGSSVTSDSTDTHVGAPRLELVLKAPTKLAAGMDVVYSLDVTNVGDAPARDVIVEDGLPAGMTVVSVTDGSRIQGRYVQFFFGHMQPGDTRHIDMTLGGASVGKLRNQVSAQTACAKVVSVIAETDIVAAEAR